MATVTLRPNTDVLLVPIMQDESGSTVNIYSKIDEVSANDSDHIRTWTFNSTITGTGVFGLEDHGLGDTSGKTISKVTVHYRVAWQSGSTTSTGRAGVRVGGNYYYSATQNLTGTWTNYSHDFTTNPDTGSAWTWSEIDALEGAVNLSMSHTSFGIAGCSHLYYVVEYSESSSTTYTKDHTSHTLLSKTTEKNHTSNSLLLKTSTPTHSSSVYMSSTKHVAQQIRERVVSLLTGLTTTGSNVHEHRVYPVLDLPALGVSTLREELDQDNRFGMWNQLRELTLSIDIFVKATSDYDETSDRIMREVENALGSDITLGIRAKDSFLNAGQFAYDDSHEQPVVRGQLEFTVLYVIDSRDPTVMI